MPFGPQHVWGTKCPLSLAQRDPQEWGLQASPGHSYSGIPRLLITARGLRDKSGCSWSLPPKK